MATKPKKTDKTKAKREPRVRKTETVRERTNKDSVAAGKTSLLAKLINYIKSKLSRLVKFLKKEIYLPLPDNKLGRFLNKRRSLAPSYFVDSWKELKQVTWPNRKQTWQLTFAVFIFAFIFGALITITDYGLDKLFEKILID